MSAVTGEVVKYMIKSLGPEGVSPLSLSNNSPSFQWCQKGGGNNIGDACIPKLLFEFGCIGSRFEVVALCDGDLFVGIHYQKLIFLTCYLFIFITSTHKLYLILCMVPILVLTLNNIQKQRAKKPNYKSQQFLFQYNYHQQQHENTKQIMTEHDKLLSRRLMNQQSHNRNLDHTIKSLQDQIELTIYNYENILQTEKKNSSERSDFLLYLIQSLRTRHLEELEAMSAQIQNAEAERQSVQSMQKQMENIGDGLDQIMEESHKLKAQNESLTKQLEEEENKQKQLDEELDMCHRELEDCRLKVDDWERLKIKWNRHKKELIELIQDAEKAAAEGVRSQDNDDPYQKIICAQSGLDQNFCDHCQKNRIEQLRQKYSSQFRKST